MNPRVDHICGIKCSLNGDLIPDGGTGRSGVWKYPNPMHESGFIERDTQYFAGIINITVDDDGGMAQLNAEKWREAMGDKEVTVDADVIFTAEFNIAFNIIITDLNDKNASEI